VDGDFRNPSLHKLFAIENRTGLSSVLTSGDNVIKTIRPTSIEGLDLLASGPVLADPSHLLNSAAFAETLAELAQHYDHVLLDSPAVNAGPDARIAAAHCDGTLLVLASNQASKSTIASTCQALASVGANLLGVVVNDAPPRHASLAGATASNVSVSVAPAAGETAAQQLRMIETGSPAVERGRQVRRG
jgi:capsular exopolysaccharide synthesis family protein